MKKLLLTAMIVCGALVFTNAQILWTGSKITFTKASGADFNQAANQDRITSNVWITRGNTQGIFNIATETSYTDFVSPDDTEWAFGQISDGVGTLTFDSWENTHGGNPPSTVNQDMVLHLITDDIYIDIKLLSWGSGMSGSQGAFSYERSTSSSTISVEDFENENRFNIYPNPTTDYVMIEANVSGEKTIQLTDINGSIVSTSVMSGSEIKLDLVGLAKGTYVLSIITENNRFNKQVVIK